MTEELDAIARELYRQRPAEFTSLRNELATRTDARDLAQRIRALRKPSMAAWVVNVFAHERAAQLGDALTLADDLRAAQDDLDAAALAQLGRQRRLLTRRLADDAAALARERGERITDATVESVHRTISAAFFDAAAAAAVASGRLVRELEPGVDSAEIADLVAGGEPVPAARAEAPEDEVAARREIRQAERALREAEAAHSRAESDQTRADRDVTAGSRRAGELAKRVADLDAQLADARAAASDAQARLREATEHASRAADDLRATAEAESQAREALARLRG